jgi:hypothetical protein
MISVYRVVKSNIILVLFLGFFPWLAPQLSPIELRRVQWVLRGASFWLIYMVAGGDPRRIKIGTPN